MPDIIASGDFGRDDGIKCACGGKTFLVDDQGYGLKAYECEECGESFQVQFDGHDEEEEYEEDYYSYDPSDDLDELDNPF